MTTPGNDTARATASDDVQASRGSTEMVALRALYTKGPWYVGAQNDGLFVIAGRAPSLNNDHPFHEAPRTVIARIDEVDDKAFGEGEANARLIAAAPDLLEACRQMFKVFTDLDSALKRAVEQKAELVHVGDLYKLTRYYVPVLDSAIAKAEGRS